MNERRPDPGAASDEPEPWVKEGLRALRDQAPSEESRRATLSRLGIDGSPANLASPGTGRALVHWLLLGVLLGVAVVLLKRWFV